MWTFPAVLLPPERPGAGQFEHTLIIVDKGAYLHFIEGCSAPKYNVANLRLRRDFRR